ncbi:uncharacterized protein SPPG_06676 [Spizellomyces punctatus DAOM BR117]|uniref:PX domain-containing protein n=1 Tax=Spizellomyces punctatus (strain DAOM BR117) TaxID=645134 RepID=A0A0L0HBM8_SPIPD|nr:uncharacterized protein SPPG_06676 [Spizellomyces punctatus DAOM BR117]KNC98279.1 hypothetical protein SPPG_06676 [Spizellomyces punctatus DAOM BR117]|eukprot:XP_016606319.1 hypothetical protein SPPG_06676 [Spizellomyces punctatus DAOM BR117]
MDDDPLSHSHVWADTPTFGSNSSLSSTPEVPAPETEEPKHIDTPAPQVPAEITPQLSPPFQSYVGVHFGDTAIRDPGFTTYSNAADNASIVPCPPSIKSESDEESDDGYCSPSRPQNGVLTTTVIDDPLTRMDIAAETKMGTHTRSLKRRVAPVASGTPAEASSTPASPTAPPVRESTPYSIQCSVTDPQKINQAMGAYVVYQVKTQTNSPFFRNVEFSVSRRFRDFLWLFNQLADRHPGIIIPPVPEKQAIGRFREDFVENRRSALEQFLRKVTCHPKLQSDEDLIAFLESETFFADKKKVESKGFMGVFGGGSAKMVESDQELERRRVRIDAFGPQLRALSKALEEWQRLQTDLASATHELGDSIQSLANVDVNKPLSRDLTVLGDLHKQVTDLREKQSKHDIASLTTNVEYYIRVVASVDLAFNSRARAYQNWQSIENALQKKRDTLEKLHAARTTRSDKIATTISEIDELDHQAHVTQNEFYDISELLRKELERFDMEMNDDFVTSMRDFLVCFVDSQRQILQLWESYDSVSSYLPAS